MNGVRSHFWSGVVATNATRRPRPARAAAKLAATSSYASPVGDVTMIARGRRSVATHVAASARNASLRSDCGSFSTVNADARFAGAIVESTGDWNTRAAVFAVRIVWSSRSATIAASKPRMMPPSTRPAVMGSVDVSFAVIARGDPDSMTLA